ncbi:hypothetical protein [Carboxylicivirga marina]|uniref:Response regulatory domain-containing protein n=1 Tax=Carboxylicivirga marina TaxID=2800988 RepID=A0ABS1HQF9_9BACT|nr:hypothetical protein [Carboxylicivirga marina]MBK3519918.1 hypothetical protein [Carboxylicivirga marina]
MIKIYCIEKSGSYRDMFIKFLQETHPIEILGVSTSFTGCDERLLKLADIIIVSCSDFQRISKFKQQMLCNSKAKIIGICKFTKSYEPLVLKSIGFSACVNFSNLVPEIEIAVHQVLKNDYYFPESCNL